jgi:hypothetical protein
VLSTNNKEKNLKKKRISSQMEPTEGGAAIEGEKAGKKATIEPV